MDNEHTRILTDEYIWTNCELHLTNLILYSDIPKIVQRATSFQLINAFRDVISVGVDSPTSIMNGLPAESELHKIM